MLFYAAIKEALYNLKRQGKGPHGRSFRAPYGLSFGVTLDRWIMTVHFNHHLFISCRSWMNRNSSRWTACGRSLKRQKKPTKCELYFCESHAHSTPFTAGLLRPLLIITRYSFFRIIWLIHEKKHVFKIKFLFFFFFMHYHSNVWGQYLFSFFEIN